MLIAKLFIKRKPVGLVEICNVTGTGTGRVSSDYYWRIHVKPRDGQSQIFCGCTADSYTVTAMQLLADVLAQWRSSPLPPGQAYDNHGNVVASAEGVSYTADEFWKCQDLAAADFKAASKKAAVKVARR